MLPVQPAVASCEAGSAVRGAQRGSGYLCCCGRVAPVAAVWAAVSERGAATRTHCRNAHAHCLNAHMHRCTR